MSRSGTTATVTFDRAPALAGATAQLAAQQVVYTVTAADPRVRAVRVRRARPAGGRSNRPGRRVRGAGAGLAAGPGRRRHRRVPADRVRHRVGGRGRGRRRGPARRRGAGPGHRDRLGRRARAGRVDRDAVGAAGQLRGRRVRAVGEGRRRGRGRHQAGHGQRTVTTDGVLTS